MPRKKTRRHLYAALLVLSSVVVYSAVLKSNVFTFGFELGTSKSETSVSLTEVANDVDFSSKNNAFSPASAPMFTTIIQGADEQVACTNNGFTIARFNLCGDSDDRNITLSGGPYGSVQWQILGGSCTPDTNQDCPNTTLSCYTTVSTGQNFTLDASTIPAGSGAEFRVVADGSQFFFKVKKSTITQTFVKRDFICGVDGRIQITNLSSSYEYSIDGGTNWQTSPIFDGLAPGTYNITARLQNTPNTCEYPYDPIEIEQLDISMGVEFVDAQCFGDTGSITVTVNDVPGPYKYTLLDENGVPQEFTTFITTNPYTFSAVGFGTYSVQVETQQCTGDPGNGIPPPRQDLDINGNPITIGDGITALGASTEVNESLSAEPSCGAASVDIIVRATGGSAPYTFTVSDGGSSAAPFTTQTTYTVNTAGSYDFTITDANGCTIEASANVVELTPPDVTVSGIDGNCTNGGAKIDINVVDGKGYNLSFRATPTDPWSTDPLLTVPAGTYNNIQVRYQQGGFDCNYTIPASVTVNSVGTIVGNAVKIDDRTCDGSGGTVGGIIEFQGPFSGGSGSGYVFSISGDSPSNFTTQTYYDNLAPGTYTPIVRDSGGCRLELTPITILDVDPPTAIAFAQSDTNCAAGTSDVQLTVTSTNPIVRYEIINPAYFDNAGNDTFDNINVNTAFEFRVTDDQGCTYTDSFTPAVISSIRARVKSGGDTRVCIGVADGSGTFIVDGFANNYTYNINGGAESAPQNNLEVDLNSLGAGSYQITVTDADTGCQDTVTLTVVEPAPLDLTGSQVTAMSCNNNNIGRVRAVVTGGFGGFTYSLEDPNGVSTPFRSNRNFGNLTVGGDYILTARDTEGCETTFNFTLTPLTAPTISIASADLCYAPGNFASVTVLSGGGGPGHEYRINNGPFQASPTFNNLVPGTYTVEVEDDNNCRAEVIARIPPQVQVSLDIIDEIPCAGDGTMEIEVSGGDITTLATTTYTIFKDGIAVAGHTGNQLPSATFNYTVPFGEHGDYTVEVTDSNGCTNTSSPITFDEPTNIAVTHSVTGPSCADTNSGFIEIIPDVTNGIPPFEIKFGPDGSLTYGVTDDGAGTLAFSSQTVYSGLAAGTYEYVVKDARGCLIPGIVDVVVAPDPTPAPNATVSPIDAVCNPGNPASGGVQIDTIADGVPEYTYVVEDPFGNEITRVTTDGSTTYPLQLLDAGIIPGNYNVITIDSRGCVDIDPVTVGSATVDIVPDPVVPLVCDVNGFTYCVDIVGGTGPFDIRLVEDPAGPFLPVGGALPTPNRNFCFNNIQFGQSFTVEVRDNDTGCTYIEVIEVPEGSSPVNVDLTLDGATCAGNDVTLDWLVTGHTGNLTIEIQNLDTGAIVFGPTTAGATGSLAVPEGPYAITVVDDGTACSDGDTADAVLNAPRVDILENINANCNEPGQLTVRGSGGTPFPSSGPGSLPDGSPYEYAYVDQGVTPTNADFTTATTVTLAGALAPGRNYDIWVRDSRNCDFRISTAIVEEDPPLPTPTFQVSNQCITGTPPTTFTIDVFMPANIVDPNFTLGGVSQFGVFSVPNNRWETTFTVSGIGVYRVDVIDANGCTSFAEPEVFQILSASGDFTTTPDCTNASGVIEVTANGGSGDFTFYLQNSGGGAITDNTSGTFTGIAPGAYQVMVEDNLVTDGTNNCTFLVENIISTVPTQPNIIDTGVTDVTCNDGNPDNGSINVTLAAGTDIDGIQEYNLYNGTLPLPPSPTPIATNTSGSFTDLGPGNYIVQVVSDLGCTDEENVTIVEPPVFEITASAPDFACEPGINTYSSTTITVTIVQTGTAAGGYQYSLTDGSNYQNGVGSDPFEFEIIDNGSPQNITVYAIDGNGCPASFTLPTINPPTDVVPTLTVEDVLNCANPERVRIDVVGTNDFTIVTNSVVAVANVNVVGATSGFVDLPAAGDYLIEIVDNIGGCTYPLPKHEVELPQIPEIIISEAKSVSCAVPGNDGELEITVTNYTGAYSYEVFAVDNLGNETSAGIMGNLNTADNPETIVGLSGGNYVVRIASTEDPFCSNVSNLATIRTPNGPLVPDAVEVGNVSCDNNNGKIIASLTGGWDVAPYEYRLLFDADNNGTYETESFTWDVNNEFENLAAGDYRVEYRDRELCDTFFDITLDAIVPITAGIREPQALVCPDGNNAVLEAFDPTTGDAVTATPGATGGVAGAGYKYQLIYLGSNDITDEISRSGLQDDPTFTGASGGFISQGWYAIEVSSSFGCSGMTIPYYVDPPPPIIPNLVQVQAPGCGGLGQMRLSIENPEVGFEYEYRLSDTAGGNAADPFIRIEDNLGNASTSVIISGGPAFYQYEVRKINATNTCGTINSNGLTLVDAQNIDLVVNLPDDISCASETDGRIESFSSGGVGSNTYTLYLGDPGDAFNPSPSATVVDSNDFGTFEGLSDATDYYIAVTSGASCQDIEGPYEVSRPAPILFTANATPVSCSGEADGSITVEVTSGGEGLLQFAIGPNFNEFFSDPDNPNTYTFEDLEGDASGREYTVLIQDSQGCSEVTTIRIFEPQEITVSSVNTPEICLGFADGTAQLTINGGTPFVDPMGVSYYETSLNLNDDANFVRNDNLFYDNLSGGETYVVFIRDANGCEANIVIPIDIGVDIMAEPVVAYGCEGIFPNSTVTIDIADRSILPNLLFSLDVDDITLANDTRIFGDLPAGEHTVYIYHENGCVTFTEFEVDEYMPLLLEAEKTGPNEITAIATGGFGDYEFFFQGESFGEVNTFNSNEDMDINIMVRDSMGCVANIVMPFNFEGMPEFPNFFTPDGDNLNDEWIVKNREFFPNIEVKIFDRYGRIVAILNEVKGWDGTYEGTPLPTGDYWYVVNANDRERQQFFGHFTLYR
ncbi:T9SS type B sorting domain-containing protein [uncultured Croceitalea sp.]|uniref:T9SS type B sorting domain-containing protein n=1 Tax=uncultured Croceitalea sp. TaxID=1798908 RepID=UPI0033057B65